MYCPNCNALITHDSKFCCYCGKKITDNNINNTNINNNSIYSNNNIINNDSQKYLIIGVLLAFFGSIPFGIGVIIFNEITYKKQLANNLLEEAKKTKKLMNTLIIIGIVLLVISIILRILFVYLNATR